MAPISWTVALLFGVSVLLISGAYYFRKIPSQVLAPDGTPTLSRAVRPELRRLLKKVFISLLFAAAIAGAIWKYYDSRPPDKTLILVANFDRQDPQYELTRIIITHLAEAAKQYPDVQIEYLPESISWQDGTRVAELEARKRKAAMILWGDYDKTSTTVNVHIHLNFPKNREAPVLGLRRDEQTLTADVSELEHFTLQQRVSKQLGYVTFVILGITRFHRGDLVGAITQFDAAAHEAEAPEDMVDPAALYFYRGSTYLYMGETRSLHRRSQTSYCLAARNGGGSR